MKKILAFAAVAVAAVAMASADPILVGHGYFGVGLGSTVTNTDGSALSNTAWNFGSNLDFGAGLGINIPFGGNFGFQPGVDFYVNNVGYHYDYTISIGSNSLVTKYDQTYSYMSIDIPLLFTIKVNKFNFAVGPYVSIPVGKVTDSTTNRLTSNVAGSDSSVKYSDRTGVNFGAVAGMGYEERLGMGRLVIGGRYMHDFLPIVVKDTNGDPVTQLWRGTFAVDIGYKIPLSF